MHDYKAGLSQLLRIYKEDLYYALIEKQPHKLMAQTSFDISKRSYKYFRKKKDFIRALVWRIRMYATKKYLNAL